MLSEKVKEIILNLQNLYPEKRSALIPALHLAQNEVGYLPKEVQEEVAFLFGLDPNDVNSIVTFYEMFYDEPVGKHIIHVCKNISCMLKGSDELLDQLCQKLHISPHKTTQDREFTVIPTQCLAACDRAPMWLMDDKVVGPIKAEEIDHILEAVKQSPGHASPIDQKEIFNA